MRFEWDEAKNARNIQKHGIDFVDAVRIISARKATRREVRLYEQNI